MTQNPNIEIPNLKQYQDPNVRNSKQELSVNDSLNVLIATIDLLLVPALCCFRDESGISGSTFWILTDPPAIARFFWTVRYGIRLRY